MADYRALRERFLRPIEVSTGISRGQGHGSRAAGRRRPGAHASGRPGRSSPPTASAPTPSARSRARPRRPSPRAKAIGGPVALKVQSPDILHKTEAGAVALNLRSADDVRAAYERVLARRAAPCARRAHPRRAGAADGAAGPRGDPRRQARRHLRPDADGGSRRRRGRGAEGRGAGAGAARRTARRASCIARLQGAALLEAHRGAPAGRYRRARRADGAPRRNSPPTTPTQSPRSISTRCWCTSAARACRWSMP